MHDSSEDLAAALQVTGSRLSRGPQFAAIIRSGDLNHPVRRRFIRQREVARWLNAKRYHPAGNQERLEWLLDTAEEWQCGGQARALAVEYERRQLVGTVGALPSNDRLVHRAVFALAVDDGPSVLAAGDYVATVLRVEYGKAITSRAVRDVLRRLYARRLIALKPSTARNQSSRADLTGFIAWTAEQPSQSVMAELSLSVETRLALAGFRLAARDLPVQGQAAESGPVRVSRPAPEAISASPGGSAEERSGCC